MKKKFKFAISDDRIMNDFDSDNEIEIKKNKIVELKYKDVPERKCLLSDDRTFTIKRLSGLLIIKCRLDFKCIPEYSGRIENVSAEIKFNCIEYLQIKNDKKELWINDKNFQIKIFIAFFSAMIGAVASYIICKICS